MKMKCFLLSFAIFSIASIVSARDLEDYDPSYVEAIRQNFLNDMYKCMYGERADTRLNGCHWACVVGTRLPTIITERGQVDYACNVAVAEGRGI